MFTFIQIVLQIFKMEESCQIFLHFQSLLELTGTNRCEERIEKRIDQKILLKHITGLEIHQAS